MTIRIATWNLEQATSEAKIAAQRSLLDSLEADIWVLTEVSAAFAVAADAFGSITTETGQRWVAIVAPSAEASAVETLSCSFSAAGRFTIGSDHVVVYGGVLPWLAAPRQVPDPSHPGESYNEMFGRVLSNQAAAIMALQSKHPNDLLIWAGDFNQTLSGSSRGGSLTSRERLAGTLRTLGLVAWNEHLGHALPGMKTIDLICGPATRSVIGTQRIEPIVDGVRLSDHACYVVEIESKE